MDDKKNRDRNRNMDMDMDASMLISPVKVNPEEVDAHVKVLELLRRESKHISLGGIPSVVPLRDMVTDTPSPDEPLSWLIARDGPKVLFKALEDLEKLQDTVELYTEELIITSLTHVVVTVSSQSDTQLPTPFETSDQALAAMRTMGAAIPRRVCQHPFRRNDIVWVCRTCQSDETCVLCHTCFTNSNHDGHDVAFYHAQAGGCCDCGDPDAWDPAGFCPNHGPLSSNGGELPNGVVPRVRGVVPACGEWLVEEICRTAQEAQQRTKAMTQQSSTMSTTTVTSSSSSSSSSTSLNLIGGGVANNTNTTTTTTTTTTAAARRQDQSPAFDGSHDDDSSSIGGGSSALMSESDGNDNHDINDDSSEHTDNMMLDYGHIFSPLAASTSKSRHGTPGTNVTTPSSALSSSNRPTPAETLGINGRKGHGLYLVVYADDIHTTAQLIDALRELLGSSSIYNDNLLGSLVRALRHHGQLVIWGTMELLEECSSNLINLWLDGDLVASGKVGAVMLKYTSRLLKHGLVCSIYTRDELLQEQRAVAVLQWLTQLARSCDPLCQTVAESLQANEHLVPMLRADFQLGARVTKAWHSLLLTLLAVPVFKSRLAAAYCDTYRHVTGQYARGMGVLERSGYTLSVQFLNRVTYVVGLVQGRDLLGKLGKSLLETLSVAIKIYGTKIMPRLNPIHFVLIHRRYSPCISDLKCVLNVKGMARLFASINGTFLEDWVKSLSLAQNMDGQIWRSWSQGHVEVEPRGWVGSFNASISLGSIFERLLSWDDDDVSPITDPSSPLSGNLMSCVDLTFQILTKGLAKWQKVEMLSYKSTPNITMVEPHRRCPASLPFSTIAVHHGSALAMKALPTSQVTWWSFHLPLHRFVAACLREVCRRPGHECTRDLFQLLGELPDEEQDTLFRGLMEFPTLVLARSAQVRTGLWRRNGPGMHDQVLNYAEPPFCRALRDADLLLLQFAVLGRKLNQSSQGNGYSEEGHNGCCFLVNLLLHRFGLFDFAGFAKAPNSNFTRYNEEVYAGIYPGEKQSEDGTVFSASGADSLVLPWTYTPAKDVATSLSLIEEFFHILIIFITELPPVPPKDKADHTNQAKLRLRREVVHRLASGPKTHSELAEVHHVLSHWDNVYLSEEGKLRNPDDATGAALETALSDVAARKSTHGRLAPDQWELNQSAWVDYDPAFFHMSLRSHQSAAENRPHTLSRKLTNVPNPLFGVEPQTYAPPLENPAHCAFHRLRKDVTADASVLAITYRTLHVHCRKSGGDNPRDMTDLRGKAAYDREGMSETVLARAVHLLTLGAYAWQDSSSNPSPWRSKGGGSVGSIFFDVMNDAPAPAVNDWIAAALISKPSELLDDEWYDGEETALVLLRRLAVDGGSSGGFKVQDRALRAGAAWLCEFAVKHSASAALLIGTGKKESAKADDTGESDFERRRREAKARAMKKMEASRAKFAAMMKMDIPDSDEDDDNGLAAIVQNQVKEGASVITPTQTRETRSLSISSSHGSECSTRSLSTAASIARSEASGEDKMSSSCEEICIPERLLKDRPQCIICVDDGTGSLRESDSSRRNEVEEDTRKRSRRKTNGRNALGFVGYAQASTVRNGGGGIPPLSDDSSPLSVVQRFVGVHVSLCGHAIHSECYESYLASSYRDDRATARKEEFRCPLCQRLSNCLVPFIDVGIDWIDSPICLPVSRDRGGDISKRNFKSSDEDLMNVDDDMTSDSDSEETHNIPLHEFLSTTPWWVSRDDKAVVWDGQCAFIASQKMLSSRSTAADGLSQRQEINVEVSPHKSNRRRIVRSLRKKDLYTAWNAMMRTPRFMRKRHRQKDTNTLEKSTSVTCNGRLEAAPQWPVAVSEVTSGETVVWRKLIDLLTEVAFRADGKRLGEDILRKYYGEFRHHVIEKDAYNASNRAAGRESVDWPACISSATLPDSRRQELAREKLLSKLLMSIKSLTYSCCSEASEARRLYRKINISATKDVGIEQDSDNEKVLYSKFGIRGFACDGQLILMPTPSTQDEGTQPFSGRIGKLRHLALAVISAAGAVSADLVQLVLAFPIYSTNANESGTLAADDPSSMDVDQPLRAPVVYPILFGHVLTHVVAAMCAACGRARARSDSLELVWPVPFSRQGSFYNPLNEVPGDGASVDNVMKDCASFIKLGMLARILQVLLGQLGFGPGGYLWVANSAAVGQFLETLSQSLKVVESKKNWQAVGRSEKWVISCFGLLEIFLSRRVEPTARIATESSTTESGWAEQFKKACLCAVVEASSYLMDAGIIFQILVPGAAVKYGGLEYEQNASQVDIHLLQFERNCIHFDIEPIHNMLKSARVCELISNWYETARCHGESAEKAEETFLPLQNRLFKSDGFRVLDWPIEPTKVCVGKAASGEPKSQGPAEPHHGGIPSIQVVPLSKPENDLMQQKVGPVVTCSSRKSVPLLGGSCIHEVSTLKGTLRPRIPMLPTSYTDLYAELGVLCPDSEQTGLCLVCGEVLNAGGKSECTKHSFKCGAGAGIFFLLQECIGLIIHSGKAAYVHSPYVDSHGETPQYRGRPLNLDLDRYNILHELWSGHTIRQKVIAERASSRQVIIPDFY